MLAYCAEFKHRLITIWSTEHPPEAPFACLSAAYGCSASISSAGSLIDSGRYPTGIFFPFWQGVFFYFYQHEPSTRLDVHATGEGCKGCRCGQRRKKGRKKKKDPSRAYECSLWFDVGLGTFLHSRLDLTRFFTSCSLSSRCSLSLSLSSIPPSIPLFARSRRVGDELDRWTPLALATEPFLHTSSTTDRDRSTTTSTSTSHNQRLYVNT